MSKKSGGTKSMLGKAIINARANLPAAKRKKNKLMRKNDEDLNNIVKDEEEKVKNMFSVLEQNSLDEFLAKAQLAGTEFTAERVQMSVVDAEPNKLVGVISPQDEAKIKEVQEKHKNYLTIPRRPGWTENTTPEELQALETESFLKWRRKLAELEEVEQLVLTPFERNIEIWRQLWRVLERSDVVVQILDARNPLLFRNEDLEKYVNEISPDKMNVLLLNKADYLSYKQRQIWSNYFNSQKIRAVFWSATSEDQKFDDENAENMKNLHILNKNLSKIDENLSENDENLHENDENLQEIDENLAKSDQNLHKSAENSEDSDISDSDSQNFSGSESDSDTDNSETNGQNAQNKDYGGQITKNSHVTEVHNNNLAQNLHEKDADLSKNDFNLNKPDLFSRDELINYFKSFEKSIKNLAGDIFTIGMVGYPNVGKSSTINKLMTRKKVAVSSTPGKTKHYQTLLLLDDLMLCDCPGLVMPSFAMSRQQMQIAGILSVDQMRDYEPSVGLICSEFPLYVFERTYGITFPKEEMVDFEDLGPEKKDPKLRKAKPRDLLTLYAFVRGFMSPKGLPDCSRAARVIVRDYINGKLRYCHAPPNVDQSTMDDYADWLKVAKHGDQSEAPASSTETLQTLQKRHLLNDESKPSDVDKAFFHIKMTSVHLKSSKKPILITSDGQRPPKKLNKNQKKDKLRRIYKHLDA